MRTTKKTILAFVVMSLIVFAAGIARADWNPTDPYKMHFPQLPDPQGWDVMATTVHNPAYNPNDPTGTEPQYLRHKILADDWLCTESGPVSDVHFWGSWLHDVVAPIVDIHLSIHEDIPDPDGPTGPAYSMPGALLWERDVTAFTVRGPYTGQQGWYNPNTGEAYWPDHNLFHQINIVDIPDPFIQKEGTIYWLDIQVTVPPADPGTFQPEWGWKTSLEHWNDDAVFSDDGLNWYELRYPANDPFGRGGRSIDLAFVITPEPATMIVLALGGLAAMFRKRNK